MSVRCGPRGRYAPRRPEARPAPGDRQGASARWPARGVAGLLENLNSRIDHPGHYLDTTPEALSIIDEVDHPAVRMLYDLYHSVVMGERPEHALDGRLDHVAHIQVADVPGRHEPGTGTIDWGATLGWLARAGYAGRLGLEFAPLGDTVASLAYLRGIVASA